jgi:hypothetical protein
MQRSARSAAGLQGDGTPGAPPDVAGANGHEAPSEAKAGADELHAAARSWGEELRVVWATLVRALELQRQEAALRLFDAAWSAILVALAALAGLILAGCATLLLVAGARRGLATWTEGAWWSDMVLGAGLAALVVGGLQLVQKAKHRRALRRAQRALAAGRGAGSGVGGCGVA